MATAELLRAHYRQMRDEGFPVYGIFDVIQEAPLPDQDRPEFLKQAAGLAEIVMLHKLQTKVNLGDAAGRLIKLEAPEALLALTAWRTTATKATNTSNRALKMVLGRFGAWIDKCGPNARAAFCEVVPELTDSMYDLEDHDVLELIDAANSLGTADDCARVLKLMGQYGITDGRTVSAMFRIARRAFESGRIERFEELVAVTPALKVINSPDAQRLIPSLAKLADTLDGKDAAVWPAAFVLVVAFAKRRFAAAHIAARDLPKRIKNLPTDTVVPYVQDFAILAEAVGPGVLDFGLNQLPSLFQTHGSERMHAFVEAAASVTECLGTTAGFHFLDRKTTAAKQLL
jgi:hypothetical protein